VDLHRHKIDELLYRSRAGNGAALSEVIERLMPLVWNVVRAQGLNIEAASDVVQATWVTLRDNLDFIRSPEALTKWLIAVAHRSAQNRRATERSVESTQPGGPIEQPGSGDNLVTEVDNDEHDRCLLENLQKLPPACQELLRIVAFAKHADHQTVKDALDAPNSSIGPEPAACLDKLRVLLQEDPRWTAE
jgi:RNA polymerase sigma factor (sigma-70 family)